MIEGGFWQNLFREDHVRNPELSPAEADAIFGDWQQSRDKPNIFEPPILSLEELRERNKTVFLTLLAGHLATHYFPECSLIGGLGVAAHVGHIFREHHDLDLLIPDYISDELQETLETHSIFTHKLGENIWRFSLNRAVILKVFSDVSPKTFQLLGNLAITVDIFRYTASGIPYSFEGQDRFIQLGNYFPLRPHKTELLTIPLKVAPKFVLEELKRLDSRAKGQLDYKKLTG